MGHWIKYYTDKSAIIGSDEDVVKGKASWRNSSLENMCGVGLYHEGLSAWIEMERVSDFWQSDTYEAVFLGETILRKRRIEVKIDREGSLDIGIGKSSVEVSVSPPAAYYECNEIELTSSHIGQWFVVEIDVKEKKISTYFSPERI